MDTSAEIANNDASRSLVMKRLISSATASPLNGGIAKTPRTLVQFWDDLESVPNDVQKCMDSWAPLEHAGYERLFFDDRTARELIASELTPRHVAAFNRCAHPAMRADFFRLCYISLHGGSYVDADDVYLGAGLEPYTEDGRLVIQPLCYDLMSDAMLDPKSAAELPDDSTLPRTFYVNNNPLIAPPAHPIVAAALERSTDSLSGKAMTRDIQSTTGPGNLTITLVQHALESERAHQSHDFIIAHDWPLTARSKWPLAYRSDLRNWRNWVRLPDDVALTEDGR